MTHLQHELLQVAAVAVAMVEQIEFGQADFKDRPFDVTPDDGHNKERYTAVDWALHQVQQERLQQHLKWGVQQHELGNWLAILMEEVGEAAQAALDDHIFPKGEAEFGYMG